MLDPLDEFEDPGCERWLFRLPRHHITYVRQVVESYEGLAQLTSKPGRGEIVWIVPRQRRNEAAALAQALAQELGMQPIAPDPPWIDHNR